MGVKQKIWRMLGLSPVRFFVRLDGTEKVPYGSVGFDGVAKRPMRVHIVCVATSNPAAGQHACGLQIRHNSLYGPLGNADTACDRSKGKVRFTVKADQNVRVVGEEGPSVGRRSRVARGGDFFLHRPVANANE